MSTAIDPQAIAGLRELNPDDPAFLRELIDLFVQDGAERVAEVERAVANQDAQLLIRAAHTLKGSCSNFGAGELARLTGVLEKHGKNAAFGEALTTLPALRAEFAAVGEALRNLR